MPETTSSPGRHVAFLAFPFTSHATLLFGLLRRLADTSPNTTFSFHSTAKSNRSLFTTSVPANVKPFDIPDGLPEEFMFSAEKPEQGVNFFVGVAEEGFRTSMAAAEAEIDRPIGCVVTDAFLWFSAGLAEEAGAMWIPLFIAGACSLFTHINTDLIREIVGTDVLGRENEIVKFIPGFSELRLGDLPSEILFGNLQSPFSIMLHQMSRVLHKATAVLVNSFEGLEPEHHKALVQKLQKVLPIGPFSLTSPPQSMDDPYGCIPWLDKHGPASVAYIGFGTVATLPPHELVALGEALEASGTPFLWSMGDKSRENLPKGFMTRTREIGKIVSWAPQVKVLEHHSIGVFINHCGWGSVLESIVAGVPIIGRPVLGDNHMNAWMVENVLKIGVRVEGGNFTKNGTISALEAVLKTEKGKKFKDQVENYKELAHKAVAPQGSSTKNFNTLVGILTGN